MSKVLDNLQYTESHEWLKLDSTEDHAPDEKIYVLGITDYAQQHLGDVVFVDLPKVGAVVEKQKEVAVVESVKSASDIYTPIGGTVIAVNEALSSASEMINKDPYGEGWIAKIKTKASTHDLDNLLNADEYTKMISD